MMKAASTVDLLDLPAESGHQQVLETFRGLRIGQTMEIVTCYDPRQIFECLRKRHGGLFSWWRLEEGPAVWRVMALRRGEPEQWSITDFLGLDHRRLAETWEDCVVAVKACDLDRVRSRIGEFVLGLVRHMRTEEQYLFPLCDEHGGSLDGGPTAVLRREHHEIEAVLGRLGSLKDAEYCQAVAQTIEGLGSFTSVLLYSHDAKEEKIFYPLLDEILDEPVRRDLILKIQAS